MNVSKQMVERMVEMFFEGKTYREIGDELMILPAQVSAVVTKLRDLGADLPLRRSENITYSHSIRQYLNEKKQKQNE